MLSLNYKDRPGINEVISEVQTWGNNRLQITEAGLKIFGFPVEMFDKRGLHLTNKKSKGMQTKADQTILKTIAR